MNRLLLSALFCLACSPTPAPESLPPIEVELPTCTVTACLAGAMTREDGANPWMAQLCEALPGTFTSCDDTGRCYPMFSAFGVDEALDAITKAQSRERCALHVVGYSWGGVNAVALAEALHAQGHPIEQLHLIDPFSPFAGPTLSIPDNVRRAFIYRHSSSPPNDCSRRAPLGPYAGFPPSSECGERCVDLDVSLTPQAVFDAEPRSYTGEAIGHCRIVRVATPRIQEAISAGRGQDERDRVPTPTHQETSDVPVE